MAQGIALGHNVQGFYIQEISEIGSVNTTSFSKLETQLRQFREITNREKTNARCDVMRCIRNVASAVTSYRGNLEHLKSNRVSEYSRNLILGDGKTLQTFELLIQNLEDVGPYFQGRLKIMNLEKTLQSSKYWVYGFGALAVWFVIGTLYETYINRQICPGCLLF